MAHPVVVFLLAVALLTSGCAERSFCSTDVRVLEYHFDKCLESVEEFTRRLYAKNPKYEKDTAKRLQKLQSIFVGDQKGAQFSDLGSDELLTAAFAADPLDPDRVYLLGLGLAKSIREAYGLGDGKMLVLGLQVELERLERLHHNMSQVNWRLKTYRDGDGDLLFLTNAVGDDGYINMGYEVLMTTILTRIQDDIYLRGGLPGKYLFDMSTLFMSIIL